MTLSRTTDPDINYTYINTTDPEFGGFAKEKIALRRAIFMSFDNAEYIRVIRKGQAIDEPYPIPPGVIGNDPTYRSIVPYDPELANKLLDYFGYKRAADGYRTWPDGKPLVWRYSSTPSSRDRELDELWQKSLDRVGIRLQVDKNRFPEELKQERACQLLSRTASWIADYPDGDDFMQLFYGPNSHENNNSCFQLEEWDRIYLKTKSMPDSPERNRLYRQLWRMVEVNGVMKMHDTRTTEHAAAAPSRRIQEASDSCLPNSFTTTSTTVAGNRESLLPSRFCGRCRSSLRREMDVRRIILTQAVQAIAIAALMVAAFAAGAAEVPRRHPRRR